MVTDSGELLAPGVALLRAAGVAVDVLDAPVTADAAVEMAAGAPVVVVGVLALGGPQLERLAAAGTRLVIRAGIGYDTIDVAAAARLGVEVANVPDYCVDEVADHTLLLLLAATRRLGVLSGLWRSGWSVQDRLPPVRRIAGASLGVVGLGRVGRAVKRRATAFGWRVLACDPFVPDAPVPIEELFAEVDAVTLHCPLNDDTRHLVDAARLRSARPGLVLVNTSRGGLVDLDAVDGALVDGRLGAVALDVLDGEPQPPLDHPLLRRPEVLVTPHVAWYSTDARHELAIKTAEEALRVLDGRRPLHLVTP